MKLSIGKKLGVVAFTVAFVLLGGVVCIKDALAATGQIYVSPASASVQNGNNVALDVRINPGTGTDTVNISVGYDAAKLKYVSTDYSGSPYNVQVGATATSGNVSFTSTELSGTPVSTDSLVAHLTFTALAGSGSTAISLAGSNAALAGVATNPAIAGATINLTSPPATCPAGQTGTPPNCTTPSTGGGTGTGSGSGTGSSPGGSTSGTKNTGGSSTGGTSSGSVGATPTIAASVTDQNVQYTQAIVTATSKAPTKVYIRFGLDGQLTATTAVSDFATSHTIALDPTLLVPGQSYSYVLVSTDQQGHASESAVQKFNTKGLSVTLGVFDSNHKPLSGKKVTLHSTPQTATTDKKGLVTFQNLAPGVHHVIYTTGKNSYDQQVSVANNVQTNGSTQTSQPQSFSVVYGFAQSSLQMSTWIWLSAAVLIVAAVIVLAQTGRLGVALQMRQTHGAPLVSQAVVVGGSSPHPVNLDTTLEPDMNAKTKVVQERLNSIPSPQGPQPGSTVTPISVQTLSDTNDESSLKG